MPTLVTEKLEIIGGYEITKGQTFSEVIKFRKNGGWDQIDLSAATAISVAFQLATDLWVTVTLAGGGITRVSGTIGDLTLILTAAQTALLKAGVGQNIEISWTIAGAVKVWVLNRCLDVIDPGSI